MRDLIEALQKDEGFRNKPYKDSVGKLTIGYGWNLDDRPMTKTSAKFILEEQIILSLVEVRGYVHTFDELNEVRQNVLINMNFNLGLKKFLKFVKMHDALERGDYKKASEEMLNSKWAVQVGNRAVRLAEEMRRGLV